MKKPCQYELCGDRRAHWDDPYVPRGAQMVEEPHRYCSFECAILDGFFCLVCGFLEIRHEHNHGCRHCRNRAVKLVATVTDIS